MVPGPPDEYSMYREQISPGFPLEHAPDESLVLDVQDALWSSGLIRAAGSLDILIAGYAIVTDATGLSADHDFEHIAAVSDQKHEYVSPLPKHWKSPQPRNRDEPQSEQDGAWAGCNRTA